MSELGLEALREDLGLYRGNVSELVTFERQICQNTEVAAENPCLQKLKKAERVGRCQTALLRRH